MNSQSEAGMFAEERKRQILTYVNKNMRVTVGDLCEEFSVSPATIRNDLNELHEKGLIKRTHGGALANTQTNFEPVTNEKNDKAMLLTKSNHPKHVFSCYSSIDLKLKL